MRRCHVALEGVIQAGERVAAIDRDQLVTELIVGRMQGDREVDLLGALGEGVDARDDAYRRDREVPSADAEVADDTFDRAEDSRQIRHRLTHSHEDDVVQASPRSSGGPRRPDDLLDDFADAQLARVASITGRTELTGHRTARLR